MLRATNLTFSRSVSEINFDNAVTFHQISMSKRYIPENRGLTNQKSQVIFFDFVRTYRYQYPVKFHSRTMVAPEILSFFTTTTSDAIKLSLVADAMNHLGKFRKMCLYY